MIRLMWRLVRALVTVLVLGGALYLGGPYLRTHAGRYLITQDPLVKADMALVLSGQPYLRVPEAARLYHERLIPKIPLVNEPRPPGQEDLLRLGTRYPDGLEISLPLLEALRVPREAVLTIPERADSLQAEADMVSLFLSGRSARGAHHRHIQGPDHSGPQDSCGDPGAEGRSRDALGIRGPV